MIDGAKRQKYAEKLAYIGANDHDDGLDGARLSLASHLKNKDLSNEVIERHLLERIEYAPNGEFYEEALLAMKVPETVYEKLMDKQLVLVKLLNPVGGQRVEAFRVKPLIMIGDMSVCNANETWARFGQVQGVIINGRKHLMAGGELKEWCSHVEEVAE